MAERPERADGWILFALVLASLIAVVDGAARSEVSILGLLALPPIVASATAGSRATVMVAVYCFVLAVIGSFWHDADAAQIASRLLIVSGSGVISVWNAGLRERVGASARGGALLADGMAMLDRTLDEQALTEELAALPVPDLAELVIVDLIADDDSIGAVAVAASDVNMARRVKRMRRARRIAPGDGHPVAAVIKDGECRTYTDMTDGAMRDIAIDNKHLDMVREMRPRSQAIVPLTARGETIGAMTLVSFGDDDRYGEDEVGFAEELGARAAAGILNARLHDEQARLAAALQQALLPRELPAVDGLEIAARFHPIGVGAQIGGDFYDLFRLADSSWGAVVGDVCGKGPEAAALTSLMRDTLRASALRGEGPAETLTLLNAAILDARADGRFCTAAYARFDLAPRGRLTVSNGGHPPALVLRKGGSVETVGEPGTLLGVFEDPTLGDTSVQLRKGDLVMLYTDGLFDVRPSSSAGGPSLADALAACKGMSAEEAASKIERSVLDAQKGSQQDDQALLVMRRV